MAASLGTAVHASIEDLLNMDLSGRNGEETGWLPRAAEDFLKTRWDEEKAAFMATPRRPDWKESKWSEAKKQQQGGVLLLLDHIGVRHVAHEQVTVALWRHLQSLTIAVEGELKTRDGRLMGRLDLLFADVDDQGEMQGWIVADLKTGNAPTNTLKPEVNRQLRMYRDILLANNPDAPPVRTEGWYTKTVSRWPAEGDNVLEQAYAAWEATKPTTMPMDPTPGPNSCGGFFATGKRGVHTGGHGANLRVLYIKGILWTQWCWFTATNQQPAPQFWNSANRWMKADAPFQPVNNSLPDLTVVAKKLWKHSKKQDIKDRCSSAQ